MAGTKANPADGNLGVWSVVAAAKIPSFEEANVMRFLPFLCSMQAVHGYELAGLSFTCLLTQKPS